MQLSTIIRNQVDHSVEPGVSLATQSAAVLDDPLSQAACFSIPGTPEDRLAPVNDPSSVGAEVLRTVASRLRQAQRRHTIKRLLVTSAIPEEGKTLLSASLSFTLAQSRQKVLMIDGDLRSSSLSRWFGIVDESFDPKWCSHGEFHMPALRKAEGLPLWIVPAGKPCDTPGAVWQSGEFATALATIERNFDWVIFDSPPLIPFGDAGVIATLSDAIVLVTRRGVTPKAALRQALTCLDKSKIIATVLNSADVPGHKYYHEYYRQMNRALPNKRGPGESRPQLLNPK